MISDLKRRKDDQEEARIGEDVNTIHHPVRDPSDDRDSSSDDDLPVLNAGSGGGPSPPPAPDPMAEARAQQALDDARAATAEKNRVAQEERDAAKHTADVTAYQGRLGAATNAARNYGTSRLAQLGIDDTYGIGSAYESELNRALGSIPELDPNPGSYLGTSLFENALSGARSGQRSNLTRRYEQAVPQGFETTFIPDTADDELINSIIGGQYTDTQASLDRARDRGTLNDTGYQTAVRNLTNARSGATARANELGLGVLETGRTSLRDIDRNARQSIADWDFGDTADTSGYEGRIRGATSSFTGGLEGRLRNAFGSTQFFDPEALISAGGRSQGATSGGALAGSGNALQNAMTEDERKRTAGSVGAF
jgi:hypothetical protein